MHFNLMQVMHKINNNNQELNNNICIKLNIWKKIVLCRKVYRNNGNKLIMCKNYNKAQIRKRKD
jgi:acetyl-CoA carboxylase alpha subunit